MNVETLLRKLQPLIPRQVEHWRAVRPLADDATRELLDQEIMATGQRALGDYWNKILLSLPPQRAVSGRFRLGTIQYERPKWPAGLHAEELMQHTAVFGRSGAGKTNVVFALIEQLSAAGIAWLFLDWKRTARELLPLIKQRVDIYTPGRSLAPLAFNPFLVPPGLETSVYTTQIADVLGEAFTLGDGARSILQKALTVCYANRQTPSLADVLAAVEAIPGRQRVQAWKISAVRALESLRFANVLPGGAEEQAGQARTLLRRNTIVELDALSESAKSFLVPILCLWLYYVQLSSSERERLQIVIVVEEAHHVLFRSEQRRKESVMNTLLRQCRELGIGMIIVDQHPHLVSSAALGNAYTTICMNLKDPADINRAAGVLQLDEGEKRYLGMLKVGEGICKKQDGHGAFLVRFPLVAVRKGSVSDDRLTALLSGSETRFAWKRRMDADGADVSRISSSDDALGEAALRFLQDVLDHSDTPVRQRYPRMGMSVRLGQRVKEQLIRRGWLQATLIEVGRTRKLVLQVTTAGLNALGLDQPKEDRQESVAHRYWKQFYARRYRDRGYRVSVEAPHAGGCFDVLAENASERVAIEIETGKSDVIANVRSALRSGCSRVIVVATDEAAMQRVERQLAATGLLIKGRVDLVLRDREAAEAPGETAKQDGSRAWEDLQNVSQFSRSGLAISADSRNPYRWHATGGSSRTRSGRSEQGARE